MSHFLKKILNLFRYLRWKAIKTFTRLKFTASYFIIFVFSTQLTVKLDSNNILIVSDATY